MIFYQYINVKIIIKCRNPIFTHVHAFQFSNLSTSFIHIMFVSHFGRNGNQLSVSPWLITEVQVSPNVGLQNTCTRTLLTFTLPCVCKFIYLAYTSYIFLYALECVCRRYMAGVLIHTSINVYLRSKQLTYLTGMQVSFYINTIKYLPDACYLV